MRFRTILILAALAATAAVPVPSGAVGFCEPAAVCAPQADAACVAVGAHSDAGGALQQFARSQAEASETKQYDTPPPAYHHKVETIPGYFVRIGSIQSTCAASVTGPGLVNRTACGSTRLDDVFVRITDHTVLPPPDISFSFESLFVSSCSSVKGSLVEFGSAKSHPLTFTTPTGQRTELSWVAPNTKIPVDATTSITLNYQPLRFDNGLCGAREAGGIRIDAGESTIVIGSVSTVACAN